MHEVIEGEVCTCDYCVIDLFLLRLDGELVKADMKATDLYRHYQKHCDDFGREILSQKRFGGYLTKAGYRRKRIHGVEHYLRADLIESSRLLADRGQIGRVISLPPEGAGLSILGRLKRVEQLATEMSALLNKPDVERWHEARARARRIVRLIGGDYV